MMSNPAVHASTITNITAAGLSKWSQSDLADFLGSGLTQDGDVVGGPMAEVVKNLEQLPESDRAAIAPYLLTR